MLEGNTTFPKACSRKNPSDRWESILKELQSLPDFSRAGQTKEFKKLKAKRTLKGNFNSVCKFFMARRFQIAEGCSKQRQKKIQYLDDLIIQIFTGDKEQD